MESNELRIGNWVNQNGNPKRVTLISNEVIYCGELTKFTYLYNIEGQNIEPIPLTPEILQKCGFAKHKNSNEYWNHWVLKNGWHISEWIYPTQMAGFEEQGVCYWSDGFITVRYLHQLQNLYLALTGEELQVSL